MKRYAIIDGSQVINAIEYETDPSNPPPGFPDGIIAVQSDTAGPGWTYANGVLTAPQPYPSWILVNNVWVAPVPCPDDGKSYMWDEATQSWKAI